MLGERGLWFKQHFWDWAARVPLIFNLPSTITPRHCDKVVSLVDLLPTLLDITEFSDNTNQASGLKLDGQSLANSFPGNDDACPNIAISDYLAIGPCVPCRMVRKGRYKLHYTHGHPSLLFDMEQDPHERNNKAGQDKYQKIESELLSIALTDWNPEELAKRVVESQDRRKLIAQATAHDQDWNYLARVDDGDRYIRAGGVDDTKGRMRLPFVEMVPPDWPPLDSDTLQELISGRKKLRDVIPNYRMIN